jgi:arginase
MINTTDNKESKEPSRISSVRNYILPNTFNLGPYGKDDGQVYKKIIKLNGANENADAHLPSNQILNNSIILEPVNIRIDQEKSDTENAIAMIKEAIRNLQPFNESIKKEEGNGENSESRLFVIGGDHTIAMGTGAAISHALNLDEVGMIWVDAHGDFNTPQTSDSKSLTGYPCAVNMGLGDEAFTSLYGSFIKKCVQIGIRDVDLLEAENLKEKGVTTYSNLDIEDLGLPTIISKSLEYLKDCKYIWLSLDIDALDTIYVNNGKTDVPVVGGLTPREMLYITDKVAKSGKLKITELVQINNTKENFELIALGSRIIELALGLGGFRINR